MSELLNFLGNSTEQIKLIIVIFLVLIFVCITVSRVAQLVAYLLSFPKTKRRYITNNPLVAISKSNKYKISNEITWILTDHLLSKLKIQRKNNSYDPPVQYGIGEDVKKNSNHSGIGFLFRIVLKICITAALCYLLVHWVEV